MQAGKCTWHNTCYKVSWFLMMSFPHHAGVGLENRQKREATSKSHHDDQE